MILNLTPLNRMTFRLYDLVWQTALPFLKRNPRIAEGFTQRRYGPSGLPAPIDLWIQAASAGESYLAVTILEKFPAKKALKILITTNTRQGFDILRNYVSTKRHPLKQIHISYFPFDSPSTMMNVVRRLCPKVTVLLETEIWPGLLMALKKYNLPAVILNGRLRPKSLKNYLIYPTPFRAVAPKKILAISEADAYRYSRLFTDTPVTIMPNIKFDRISFPDASVCKQKSLNHLFDLPANLVVFGSIRAEEEPLVEKIISKLLHQLPHIRIALFPRHMHRLNAWQNILDKNGQTWVLRSAVTLPVLEGTIILWDTFGELAAAYALATTVFVGGSLADLGGQNFLEPLSFGVRPVIGPYWDNFFWIGHKIFSKKIVQRCTNWQTTAAALINAFKSPLDSSKLKAQAQTYIQARQGGAQKACSLIEDMLEKADQMKLCL
jgi:3-deoxy-D-manno-octulosonic-acid transferase